MLRALVGVLAVLLVVSGCGSAGRAAGPGRKPPRPNAAVRYEGHDGTSPTAPVGVSVPVGKVEQVALTNDDGKQVSGQASPDGRRWTAREPLGYGKNYTWSGRATGTDGKPVPLTGSFSTVKPAKRVKATLNPTDGAEVGVGMPISVKFNAPVRDRAAAERALEVHTSTPVEGSWAWVSAQQVDYRPKQYWPANTDVKVEANLYGVHYGQGAFGADNVTTDFHVGRSQVVKADARTHQLVVLRDGQQVASYPASYGEENDPERNTPNGTYTVMEKKPEEIMDNPKFGYTNVHKKWAERISNHGEFIHENDENAPNLGKRNNSHGCVNLSGADAKAYFDSALLGDPVEVSGGVVGMPTNFAVFDWLLSWDQWKHKSAL